MNEFDGLCPKCGSVRVCVKKTLPPIRMRECFKCGHHWRTREINEDGNGRGMADLIRQILDEYESRPPAAISGRI